MSRTLSPGSDPADQAAWVEGFLAGDALLIIEDRRILRLLDEWVRRIDDRAFVDALPSLRRAMGSWSRASRRALARRLAQGEQADTTDSAGDDEELLAFAALKQYLSTRRVIIPTYAAADMPIVQVRLVRSS